MPAARTPATSALGRMLAEILDGTIAAEPTVLEEGGLPSVFPVTELATASVAAAGLAVADLVAAMGQPPPRVEVDRRLASFWFGSSIRPQGWELPPAWDAIAGDYLAADGWIRLHINAVAHRRAALAVLGVAADRERVAAAVSTWPADELEAAVVAAGGCAAAMRSAERWEASEPGRSVAGEPLIRWADGGPGDAAPLADCARPLAGVRVMDLTRVLAGPVATRFLAQLGADVLRIDPPWWDEPGLVPDVMLGKRSARLDLREARDRERLLDQLAGADVLVHGYRPGALDGLGLDRDVRQRVRPGLIEVSLDAYGWTGPWAGRRGFDSLVQMSTGIAEAGMRLLDRDRPTPLPVQALDHATGYLMAHAAVRALAVRLRTGRGSSAALSLARTARLLTADGPRPAGESLRPEDERDLAAGVERTAWGPARRLSPPVSIAGVEMRAELPARGLGSEVL
ncbi:CoA transferase [Microbacterium marinilacus]|uniref:CoA transferase n=1 Tax=Microbacterium marinilacus TaxID=415209 RepID=A0ABP7BJW5_9MICO|nr:CoA transferase [Microbacterium marinilacus]MBY0687690.1 CoA transferase [Microbacterium marinilacus]